MNFRSHEYSEHSKTFSFEHSMQLPSSANAVVLHSSQKFVLPHFPQRVVSSLGTSSAPHPSQAITPHSSQYPASSSESSAHESMQKNVSHSVFLHFFVWIESLVSPHLSQSISSSLSVSISFLQWGQVMVIVPLAVVFCTSSICSLRFNI